jgi:serine/threonine protein kinase
MTKTSTTYDEGRYTVKGVLGRGAHATVYEVYDNELQKLFALKVLNQTLAQSDLAEALFEKEVSSLNRFHHPSVVELKRSFRDTQTGAFCIVLERVPKAESLFDLIRSVEQGSSSPRSIAWCLDVLESIIDGLEKAHSKQVVHRDLNLKNILLGHDGDREFVKIVDFGIARLLDQFGTTHTSLTRIWTYPFVSPEHALNRDVRQSSDYFVFGLIAASLLTWQVPKQDHVLQAQDIEELLKPLSKYINDAYIKTQIHTLIVSLMNPEPLQRPIPAMVKRVFNEIKLEFTDRPELKLRVPRGVEDEIKTLDFDSVEAFFHDLNHSTMARYQTSQQEDQQNTIYFFGRSTWAATKSDKQSGDQEQLVLVKAGRNNPDEHRRRTRGASYCRYQLKVGFGNAYEAMNEIYKRTLQNNELKELERKKRDFFRSSSFILDTLEERAKNLTFLYENLDTETVSDAIRMTITGVTEFNSVTGQEAINSVDEALETLLNLDSESAFSARVEQQREKIIGRFLAFNPETRILTLRPTWNGKIPKDGYLTSVDAGALVSIRRQRAALNRFIKDDTVNPQLGNLILSPRENSRGLLPLVSLKQELEFEAEVQEIVEHALAAQDFYFIQGPPGTGKTTLIIELMAQILERDKRAKVLLTAQPNEAVNHAFEKFRKLTNNSYRDLLFTKGADELSSNYLGWGRNVIVKSKEALNKRGLLYREK